MGCIENALGRLQSFDAAGHRVKKDSVEIGLDKSETILYIRIVDLIKRWFFKGFFGFLKISIWKSKLR